MRFLKAWQAVVFHEATLDVRVGEASVMVSHDAVSGSALGVKSLHTISVLGGYPNFSLFRSFLVARFLKIGLSAGD